MNNPLTDTDIVGCGFIRVKFLLKSIVRDLHGAIRWHIDRWLSMLNDASLPSLRGTRWTIGDWTQASCVEWLTLDIQSHDLSSAHGRVSKQRTRCCFIPTGLTKPAIGWFGRFDVMLLAHSAEYMANGLTNAIRHQFAMIASHSYVFVSIRGRSWGVANIRNMLLKFARKAWTLYRRGDTEGNTLMGRSHAILQQYWLTLTKAIFNDIFRINNKTVIYIYMNNIHTGKMVS